MVQLGVDPLGPVDMFASVAVICEGRTEHAMASNAASEQNFCENRRRVSTLDGMVALVYTSGPKRHRAMRTESVLCSDSGI